MEASSSTKPSYRQLLPIKIGELTPDEIDGLYQGFYEPWNQPTPAYYYAPVTVVGTYDRLWKKSDDARTSRKRFDLFLVRSGLRCPPYHDDMSKASKAVKVERYLAKDAAAFHYAMDDYQGTAYENAAWAWIFRSVNSDPRSVKTNIRYIQGKSESYYAPECRMCYLKTLRSIYLEGAKEVMPKIPPIAYELDEKWMVPCVLEKANTLFDKLVSALPDEFSRDNVEALYEELFGRHGGGSVGKQLYSVLVWNPTKKLKHKEFYQLSGTVAHASLARRSQLGEQVLGIREKCKDLYIPTKADAYGDLPPDYGDDSLNEPESYTPELWRKRVRYHPCSPWVYAEVAESPSHTDGEQYKWVLRSRVDLSKVPPLGKKAPSAKEVLEKMDQVDRVMDESKKVVVASAIVSPSSSSSTAAGATSTTTTTTTTH